MNADVLLFFSEHRHALPLYEAFEHCVLTLCPEACIKVQKTQISFYNKHQFACVSFLRVRKKKELPDPYIVITFGLPDAVQSSRIAVATEPYPGRWTHHVVIGRVEEIDDVLMAWIAEAAAFAAMK